MIAIDSGDFFGTDNNIDYRQLISNSAVDIRILGNHDISDHIQKVALLPTDTFLCTNLFSSITNNSIGKMYQTHTIPGVGNILFLGLLYCCPRFPTIEVVSLSKLLREGKLTWLQDLLRTQNFMNFYTF